MSGSTRIVQVTPGISQIAAAAVAVALAIVMAGVLAFGQLTAKPGTAPAPGAGPVLIDQGTGSGGSNGTRFPR
jgi:hypothetical protein